ncbi:class I SAM-dependent methyltransferase [Microvirga sp. ACRRW]|uniref:class I SAM-dependent methyltransferase n=1 Tax=Microvirga sp. ACRRW TaxID=2918205 RepID=UPI001EF5D1A5|nr:class I SAM-dependent methyltransferase [Microvirga sp. ACRRW]MCG7392682.1 class I SAM-dependent methyltransferase [Microvirga sp. ACRRW]
MDKAEFDSFADEYYQQHSANIAITGEAPEYFAEYKIKVLAKQASKLGITPGSALDFGSGIGNSIPHFRHHMPSTRLVCADVSSRSLELAQTRFGEVSQTLLIAGQNIPAPDNQFDVTFSACVFHHIPHEEHVHWMSELLRVTRPGGMLSIFEHNPLNPLTLRAVNTCPFDINARLIRASVLKQRFLDAGWHEPKVDYHVFFPRQLASLRTLEPHLARIPLGGQYSVSATKRS